MSTDRNGYVIDAVVTPANTHDSRTAYPLIDRTLTRYSRIRRFKADKGYKCGLDQVLPQASEAVLECVKSNFGTSEFIPLKGRWVVERTFSWMENYRRLTRKLPLSGIFPVNFANISGHNARIAPYEIDKIPSKICRPGINISCGLGSKSFGVSGCCLSTP